MQLLAICWLTVPSIQSMMPLVPLLPTTIRSDCLARDASVMVFAGLPSMTMGTVLRVGCFCFRVLFVFWSIFLWLSFRASWYSGRYEGSASVSMGGG